MQKGSMTDQVLDYIKQELQKGFTKQEVLERLIASGYDSQKILALLKNLPETKKPEEKHVLNFGVIVLIIILLIGISFALLVFFESEEPPAEVFQVLVEQIPEKSQSPNYSFDPATGIITFA